MEDLSVAGPGSPISMAKVVKTIAPSKDLTVLLDQTGSGFVHDEPSLVNVMIADRIEQCNYWRDNIFNGKQLSAYLYRYIHWVMVEDCARPPKYPTDQSVADAFTSGDLTVESAEYKQVFNYANYCKASTEITHLIGLVQLVGGALSMAKKQKAGIRLFIEQPETGFHPKRERCLVTILYRLRDEYGFEAADENDNLEKEES